MIYWAKFLAVFVLVNKMRQIGLFGGTFDPPHIAHRQMALAFADFLSLDEVILIPAGQPYHKNPTQTSTEHRLKMCCLLAESDSRLSVSDIDIVRQGATYTIDTLTIFQQTMPEVGLWWLMGSDSMRQFHTWKRYQELLHIANFAIACRGHDDFSDAKDITKTLLEQGQKHAEQNQTTGQIILLPTQPENISSTQIRTAIAHGEDVHQWIEPSVMAYIQENHLYQKQE